MAVIRPHIRISSPIQQHDNQGSSQGLPTAYESHVARQAWGKRERALACVSQLICATRYYDAPRPQGQASEIFQPSKASPTCGGDGRRPF